MHEIYASLPPDNDGQRLSNCLTQWHDMSWLCHSDLQAQWSPIRHALGVT